MNPFKSLWSRFLRFYNALELSSLLIGLVLGIIVYPLIAALSHSMTDVINDLWPELFGIVFTVLILDRLDARREERLIREQLIRRVHSRYNNTALSAIEEMRVLGYLEDGTLSHRELRGSHWENANMYKADLRGSDLRRAILVKADFVLANLEGTQVTDEQLASTDIMHGATLPDGTRYDGRFNLVGDFNYAKREKITLHDPKAMATWYGVSLERYLEGQQWYEQNKHRFPKRSTEYDFTDSSNVRPDSTSTA